MYYEYKTRKHINDYSDREKQVLFACLIQLSIHLRLDFLIKEIKTASCVEKSPENIYRYFLAYLRK